MKALLSTLAAFARASLLAERARPGWHLPRSLHALVVYGFWFIVDLAFALVLGAVFVVGIPLVFLAALCRRRPIDSPPEP